MPPLHPWTGSGSPRASAATHLALDGLTVLLCAAVCAALCVRYIIASHLDKAPKSFRQGRYFKIAWLFLAALFTFGLQASFRPLHELRCEASYIQLCSWRQYCICTSPIKVAHTTKVHRQQHAVTVPTCLSASVWTAEGFVPG